MTKIDLALKYLGYVLQDPTFGTNLRDEFYKELAAIKSPPPGPKKIPISFGEVNGKWGWNNISQELRDLWKISCPAVDIEAELAAAAAWMLVNPQRAPKANYGRFLDGWMKRRQQSGGTRGFVQTRRDEDRKAEEWAKTL